MRTFLILCLLLVASPCFADDILMMRTGQELRGKLDVAGEKEILFKVKKGNGLFGSTKDFSKIPTSEVYMIKTDKRGTIFFNRAGERLMRSTQKYPKDAALIYTVDGEELGGFDLNMADGVLSFKKDPKEGNVPYNVVNAAKSSIFLIKYPDGSKDLLTDISLQALQAIPEEKPKEETPKIKVVMHTVVKGETYADIAKQYGVTVAQIVEWNELSSKTTGVSRAAANSQLMIQLPFSPEK